MKPHQPESFINPFPDFFAGNTEVLTAKSDIVAHAFQDDLVLRVLKNKPHSSTRLLRGSSVDVKRATLGTFVFTEYTSESSQQRALTNTGSSQQEDSLPRIHLTGDVGQRWSRAGSELPTPPLR
jgi:hypothetical protein